MKMVAWLLGAVIVGSGVKLGDSKNYCSLWIRHLFLLVPAQEYVGRFIATFRDFPPRQKPAKFNMEDVMRNMQEGASH